MSKNLVHILRQGYIKITDMTHSFQSKPVSKFLLFYRWWAPFYDLSVKLDPAYCRHLHQMIDTVVESGSVALDIGCGTELGTIYAATRANRVVGIDPSKNMLKKLRKTIRKRHLSNIDIREGFFPEAISENEKFHSVICSFMLAHLNKEQRTSMVKDIFNVLSPGG